MPTPSSYEVRAALLKRGDTVSSWARRHGYRPETAIRVLGRWTGKRRTNRSPSGLMTREILRRLGEDTGLEIVPGLKGTRA